MKIFDISKNIILVFIILISIALNLFAHESTTSLISNNNVSIEKDKNKENLFRKEAKKVVLCYERNKKGVYDYILPLIYTVVGAILTLAGSWFTSFLTDRKRRKTIKKELENNKNYLTEKYKNIFEELLENDLLIEAAYPAHSPNIKSTRLTKDLENNYFIHLSDTSWNQYKYVISNKDIKITKAYMLIGEINALSKASVHTDKGKTLSRLAQAIIKAKDAIDEAIV